jgi:hypothetical protein
MTDVWGERGPLGIIHREVSKVSWFKPMKVGCYIGTDGKAEGRRLACADIHISWEMMIDLEGKFYCNGPESSSYFMATEQSAFMWEFSMTHRWRQLRMPLDAREVSAVLASRLAAVASKACATSMGKYTALIGSWSALLMGGAIYW